MGWLGVYATLVVFAFAGLVAMGIVGLWFYAQSWRDVRYWFRKQARDMWSTIEWLADVAPLPATVQWPCDPSPRRG